MKFLIKNIGKVKSAEIELNGLTVLTGENSVGKSTVGKAIFSFVKGIDKALDNYQSSKFIQLKKLLSGVDDYLINDLGLNGEVRTFFQPDKVLLDLKEIDELNHSYSSEVSDHLIAFEYVVRLEQEVLRIVKNKKGVEKGNQIVNLFNQLKGIVTNSWFTNSILNKGIDEVLSEVMNGDISNRFTDETAKIELYKGEHKINSIEINKAGTSTFLGEFPKFNSDGTSVLVDSTIIDSPLVLSLGNFIKNSLAFNRANIKVEQTFQGLPFQTFDLLKKLSQSNLKYQQAISQGIIDVIGGVMSYDEGKDDFVYTDDQENKFNIGNVASGIKAFGLLQMLNSTGNLHKQSLLILDEPEVHLHPFWQLEYAKLIVKLVEGGIPILLSTHSPYFLEALKTYSDQSISNRTKFYLGKEHENGSIFQDVTSNMEELFNLFAQPMQKLVWI